MEGDERGEKLGERGYTEQMSMSHHEHMKIMKKRYTGHVD